MNAKARSTPAGKGNRGISPLLFRMESGRTFAEELLKKAAIYSDLWEAVCELIQNELDADATLIKVRANTTERMFTVSGDGAGISSERMRVILTSIGKSDKTSDLTKLGRYGLGMMSPLDKCEWFEIISTPSDDDQGYHRWIFRRSEIEQMGNEVFVPAYRMEDLIFDPARNGSHLLGGKQCVDYRTRVVVHKYSSDSSINELTYDQLSEQIKGRYSEKMLLRGARIDLRIKGTRGKSPFEDRGIVDPVRYNGFRYAVWRCQDSDAGQVQLELYTKETGDPALKAGVLDDLYSFPFSYFVGACRRWYPKEDLRALNALLKGQFVGRVSAEKVVLKETRTSFVKSDACLALLRAVGRWYDEVGRSIIEDRNDLARIERYSRASSVALQQFEAVLRATEGGVRGFVEQFQLGSVGPEHARVPKSLVEGKEEGVRVIPIDSVISTEKPSKPRGDRSPKPDEKILDTPFVNTMDGGRERRVVRNNSLGLAMRCAAIEDEYVMYRMDWDRGELTFNTMHEHFRVVESKESTLARYQLTVMSHVFGSHDVLKREGWSGDKEMQAFLDSVLSAALRYNVLSIVTDV